MQKDEIRVQKKREGKRKHESESVGAGEEKEPFLFWSDVCMESWTFPLGVCNSVEHVEPLVLGGSLVVRSDLGQKHAQPVPM